MNILITNDDSINADGLQILIEAAKDLGNVYVVAPTYPQSGMSSAMTVRGPLVYEPIKLAHTKEAYALQGTPADCVRAAFSLFDVAFDLVLSGVNQGANISSDVYHSGTLGAVFEGLILGIPGIAVSANYYDLSLAKRYTKAVIKTILDHQLLSVDYALNVNFPETMTTPNIMITHQGRAIEKALFDKDDNTLIPKFYRGLTNDKTSDLYAYYNEYISITPIKFDKTDYEKLTEFSNQLDVINHDFKANND